MPNVNYTDSDEQVTTVHNSILLLVVFHVT